MIYFNESGQAQDEEYEILAAGQRNEKRSDDVKQFRKNFATKPLPANRSEHLIFKKCIVLIMKLRKRLQYKRKDSSNIINAKKVEHMFDNFCTHF